MRKLDIFCTAVLLLAAMACGIINFPNTVNNAALTSLNITATIFFVLFWVLMLRFRPAAKTSAFLGLYVFAASMVGFCSLIGEWANVFTKIFTTPAATLFYGVKFVNDYKFFYVFMAIVSFSIVIYSLITLVNKKPAPTKAEKAEAKAKVEAEAIAAAETVPAIAEGVNLDETEVVAEAAKYVEMINTFENEEIETELETEQP